MRKYEKPNFEITSYESEDIITLSGKINIAATDPDFSGVQTTFDEIQY